MCGIVGILGQEGGRRRTSSTRCAGSSIAATTRPASPPSRTATSSAAAPRASCATSKRVCSSEPLQGRTGIGHTRWATHGTPIERNAHPHMNGRVVGRPQRHHRELPRAEGRSSPPRATSSRPRPTPRPSCTSSPTSWRRVTGRRGGGAAARCSVCRAPSRSAIIFAGDDNLMIGARQGRRWPSATATGEMYLGSDAIALAPVHRRHHLPRGRRLGRAAPATASSIFDRRRHARSSGRSSSRSPARCWSTRATTATSWPRRSTSSPRSSATRSPTTSTWPTAASTCPISASTSASIAARHHLGLRHRLLRRPRRQVLARALRAPAGRDRRRLRVPLSRAAAGEGRALAVRLAVGRDRRHAGHAALLQGRRRSASPPIVNVRTSTIARESDIVLPTLAGPEIGVASTKAFTCQLAVLACLAHRARPRARDDRSRARSTSWCGR